METHPDPNRLVSPEGLAAHWSVSRPFIYRLLREGMPSLKLGRARRIRVSDAEAWLAARQHADAA